METIVIVHGPMASGKTRNASALKRHFGCLRIVEAESRQGMHTKLQPGDLVLTNAEPPFDVANAKVVGIREALRALNLGWLK
jgi:predicted kinase